MKPSLLTPILCAITLVSLTATAADKPSADELKKIEGTWVGGVKNPGGKGKSGSGTMVAISEFVVKDGKIASCKDGKGLSLGTCDSMTLDPTSKTLDAKGNLKNGKGGNFQGIYRVNGDTLEWCAANPGIARPKDFFTTPQVQFHMVFTKKK